MIPVRERIKEIAQYLLLVVLFPLIILLGTLALVLFGVYWLALNTLIRILWLSQGKDVLLVYSDSPIWLEYITREIAPLVKDRAKVLIGRTGNAGPVGHCL